jgi:hypothetical protein
MNYNQKKAAATDPNTAPEILEQLAADDNPNIRYDIARNPNTPKESLQLLATDKYPDVRYCVARHPNRTELIERLVFMTDYNQFSS